MKLKTLIHLMVFAWRVGYMRGQGDTRPVKEFYMAVVRRIDEDNVEVDVGSMLGLLAPYNDWEAR